MREGDPEIGRPPGPHAHDTLVFQIPIFHQPHAVITCRELAEIDRRAPFKSPINVHIGARRVALDGERAGSRRSRTAGASWTGSRPEDQQGHERDTHGMLHSPGASH